MKNRSLHYIVASIVAVLTAVLCAQAQNQPKPSKDEQALTALVRQMTDAQSKFDPMTLERIYASDFIEISPVGEVDPREKTIGFYKPEANPDRDKMKMAVTTDEFLIRTYGNFAVVIARITFAQAGNEPSARPPISVRATLVCRKEKGVWKIGSAQYTGIRPARPQPAK
jgi:ketosteroid isomerase-like protein